MTYQKYTPQECLITKKNEKGEWEIVGVNYEKVADSINARFDILRVIENDEYFIYQNGVYASHAWEYLNGVLYKEFAGICKGKNGQFVLNEKTIKEALKIAFSRKTCSMQAIDEQPPFLNMKEGFLDLNTLEMEEHTPNIVSFDQSPIRYDPKAECSHFLEFLDNVLEPKYKPTLSELFGWTLWPQYHIHQAIMLFGPKRAGKGTTLRVLTEMLGKDNCSNQSLQNLCMNRFSPSRLFGMKANIFGDLPDTPIPDAMVFKALTGGDAVDVEKKGKDAFTLYNRAKMWFGANDIPAFKIDNDALYSRWKLIPYKNSYYGKEDVNLTAKLTTPEELSGILNWSLEGLSRLRYKNWKFSDMLDGCEVYKKQSKPHLMFLVECCESSSEEYIFKADLLKEYNTWAKEHELPPASSKIAFGKHIIDQTIIPVESGDRGSKGNQAQAWIGIKLK